MPLKHFTETFLVVLLGAIIALTGLLTASLPHLPEGALPWVVLFALTLVYPLVLLPMFRLRRADTFFRNLHWFPALMLLVWLALEGLRYEGLLQNGAIMIATWGWSLVGVAIGFLLLVYYCLQVIRRRVPRIAFLALILIPFTAVAFLSERTGKWDQDLAAVLWGADFWKLDTSTGAVALLPTVGRQTSEPSLDPSTDEKEEQWRMKLREQERREERIAGRMNDAKSVSNKSIGSANSVAVAESSAPMVALSGTGDEIRNSGTMPGKLPSSGFGWATLISLFAAGYTSALHRRAASRA